MCANLPSRTRCIVYRCTTSSSSLFSCYSKTIGLSSMTNRSRPMLSASARACGAKFGARLVWSPLQAHRLARAATPGGKALRSATYWRACVRRPCVLRRNRVIHLLMAWLVYCAILIIQQPLDKAGWSYRAHRPQGNPPAGTGDLGGQRIERADLMSQAGRQLAQGRDGIRPLYPPRLGCYGGASRDCQRRMALFIPAARSPITAVPSAVQCPVSSATTGASASAALAPTTK